MITTFDGHLHIPDYRVNDALLAAQRNGLDALMFTDRDNTQTFDDLSKGLLELDDFDVYPANKRALSVTNDVGEVMVYRGQEPRTKQGDVLIWGGSKPVEPGRDIEYTIDEAVKDGAHVVLAHPFFSRGSVGSQNAVAVYDLIRSYDPSDLSFEMNAQFPRTFSVNYNAGLLEFHTNRFPFYNSDTHGHYGSEHKKVGEYFFNKFPFSLEHQPHDALRALAELPVSADPASLARGETRGYGGRLAHPVEVALWNARSLLNDPVDKLKGVFGLND